MTYILLSIKSLEFVDRCSLSPHSPKKISRRTNTFSTKLGKCSFDVFVLQRTAEKPTRLYFARAVSLFCSLRLLFGGVLHDVVVVAFFIKLIPDTSLE